MIDTRERMLDHRVVRYQLPQFLSDFVTYREGPVKKGRKPEQRKRSRSWPKPVPLLCVSSFKLKSPLIEKQYKIPLS